VAGRHRAVAVLPVMGAVVGRLFQAGRPARVALRRREAPAGPHNLARVELVRKPAA